MQGKRRQILFLASCVSVLTTGFASGYGFAVHSMLTRDGRRLVSRMEATAPEDGNKQEVKADAAAENEVQFPDRENDAG